MANVLGIHWLTEEIFELEVSREGLDYKVGDCTLLVRDDGVDSRPYSFSSHPSQPALSFLVRFASRGDPAGYFSAWLAKREPGDPIGVGTPFGGFSPGKTGDEVWLATGTGLSPFLACLRGPTTVRPILYCGVRWRSEALFRSFLESRCEVRWAFSREDPGGRWKVSAPDFPLGPGFQYFLCGNGAMIRETRTQLLERGIGREHIHEESFFG